LARPRRANVVRLPSETWLLQACEALNQLPEDARVVAFQSILQRYKKLRADEQGAPQH
jgi:hypothetical protein